MENREPLQNNPEDLQKKLAEDLQREISKTPAEKQAERIAREAEVRAKESERTANLNQGPRLEIEKNKTELAREVIDRAPNQPLVKENIETAVSTHYKKELEKSFNGTPFSLEKADLTDTGYEILIKVKVKDKPDKPDKPVYDVKELPLASQKIYSKLLTGLINESAIRFGKSREEVQSATKKAQQSQGKTGIWSRIKGIFGFGK